MLAEFGVCNKETINYCYYNNYNFGVSCIRIKALQVLNSIAVQNLGGSWHQLESHFLLTRASKYVITCREKREKCCLSFNFS